MYHAIVRVQNERSTTPANGRWIKKTVFALLYEKRAVTYASMIYNYILL